MDADTRQRLRVGAARVAGVVVYCRRGACGLRREGRGQSVEGERGWAVGAGERPCVTMKRRERRERERERKRENDRKKK